MKVSPVPREAHLSLWIHHVLSCAQVNLLFPDSSGVKGCFVSFHECVWPLGQIGLRGLGRGGGQKCVSRSVMSDSLQPHGL